MVFSSWHMYVKQCMNVKKKLNGGVSGEHPKRKLQVFFKFYIYNMLGQMLKSQKFKNDRQKTNFFI